MVRSPPKPWRRRASRTMDIRRDGRHAAFLRMRLEYSAPLYHSSRGCNTFGNGRRFAYIRRVGPKATRGIRAETGFAMSVAEKIETEAGRDFIRDIVSDDLAAGRHNSVFTRFPPHPNRYLHIRLAQA